ncbi:hypothetical protein MUK42_35850 [Musa troglodytarum]|uniref:Uncharacterized protein n=1 Tax=Musa troglodytarum TaxID=320322 RepID=A0A9E7H5N6_9LILI|nr:hypothetical protein MUK42_35850 [Musa troglodytarum]
MFDRQQFSTPTAGVGEEFTPSQDVDAITCLTEGNPTLLLHITNPSKPKHRFHRIRNFKTPAITLKLSRNTIPNDMRETKMQMMQSLKEQPTAPANFHSARSLSFVVLDPLCFDCYAEASRLDVLLGFDSLPSPDRLRLALLDSWHSFIKDSVGETPESKDEASGRRGKMVTVIIICIFASSFVMVACIVASYKYWQKRKREQDQARFLKLFEEGDDIEDELGLGDAL